MMIMMMFVMMMVMMVMMVMMMMIIIEKQEKKKPDRVKKGPPAIPLSTGKYGNDHIKGQSVEDLLESDDYPPNSIHDTAVKITSQSAELDMMFFGDPYSVGGSDKGPLMEIQDVYIPPPPKRRKELVENYIRKPQYSVRRVTLLCEWVNSLHVWPNPVSINTLHKEMCNGLLLARIVKILIPTVKYVNLNEKALSKKPALENLEQALGNLWRSKALNNTRIPSAMEIYMGNTSKIGILLNEIYGVYVQRPLYKNALTMMRWYHYLLRQYNLPVPLHTFEDGDLSSIWPHFQSGFALFCIIFHLFGPNIVGNGINRQRIDPLRIISHPNSLCDFRNNLYYVFHLLEALAVDVIWTPEDWISNPDTEFMLLQLSFIYEAFKMKQSALPPAQGTTAGITSGPNGEPRVVGIIFADTRSTPNAKILPIVRKAVLLGYDKDSMPLLPVDRGGKIGRYINPVCPFGMMSSNVQLSEITIKLKESKNYTGITTIDLLLIYAPTIISTTFPLSLSCC